MLITLHYSIHIYKVKVQLSTDHQMEVAVTATATPHPAPAPTTDATIDPSGAGKAKKPEKKCIKNPEIKKRIHCQKRGVKKHPLLIL